MGLFPVSAVMPALDNTDDVSNVTVETLLPAPLPNFEIRKTLAFEDALKLVRCVMPWPEQRVGSETS